MANEAHSQLNEQIVTRSTRTTVVSCSEKRTVNRLKITKKILRFFTWDYVQEISHCTASSVLFGLAQSEKAEEYCGLVRLNLVLVVV